MSKEEKWGGARATVNPRRHKHFTRTREIRRFVRALAARRNGVHTKSSASTRGPKKTLQGSREQKALQGLREHQLPHDVGR